ncbi:MAG: hypothetical protein QW046_05335 [Candidatus Micrarchaeaceae archaeon]
MSNVPQTPPAGGKTAVDEQIQQTQTQKQQNPLPDKGILPANEEVYDALVKIFGIDIEKGSRQIYKATFYDDYATVNKLDINDIKRLLSDENRNESEIILKKGKLLFQFEVGELDMTTLVKNLKSMSFAIKYKSEELVRARKESENAIYDLVIKNPTSSRPIIEMFVEGIDNKDTVAILYAHKIEFKEVVTSLLESQKYYRLAEELANEMEAREFSEDVIRKWQNIDLNKYNRDVTIIEKQDAFFGMWLCYSTEDDCKQYGVEQKRKLIDEQIQRMNEKLQKLVIIARHNGTTTGIKVRFK